MILNNKMDIIYLDIDSYYRDREMYSSPMDFTTSISTSTGSEHQSADCSESLPVIQFKYTPITVTPGTTPLSNIDNYYVGTIYKDTVLNAMSPVRAYVSSPMFFYTDLSDEIMNSGHAFELQNPSSNSSIYIPGDIQLYDNAYSQWYIRDTTIDEVRRITGFSGQSRCFSLDSPFGPAWASTDAYEIFKSPSSLPRSSTALTVVGNTVNGAVGSTTVGDYVRVIYDDSTSMQARVNSVAADAMSLTTGTQVDTSKTIRMVELHHTNKKIATSLPYNCIDAYEYIVEILWLTLPNVTVDIPNHGTKRISELPGIYLELSQYTGPNWDNVIYTNRPGLNRASYKLYVVDFYPQHMTSFIKCISKNSQTFYVDSRLPFKFKLYYSYGSDTGPLTPTTKDSQPPTLPNPYLQMSGLFSFTPVKNRK